MGDEVHCGRVIFDRHRAIGERLAQIIERNGLAALGAVGFEVAGRSRRQTAVFLKRFAGIVVGFAQFIRAADRLRKRHSLDVFEPAFSLVADVLVGLPDGLHLAIVLAERRGRVVHAGQPARQRKGDSGGNDAGQPTDCRPHDPSHVGGRQHRAAQDAQRHGEAARAKGRNSRGGRRCEQACAVVVDRAHGLCEPLADDPLSQRHLLHLRADESHALTDADEGRPCLRCRLDHVDEHACQLQGSEGLSCENNLVEILRHLCQDDEEPANHRAQFEEDLVALCAVGKGVEGLQCVAQFRDEALRERELRLEDVVLEAPDVSRHAVQRSGKLRPEATVHLVSELEQVALGRQNLAVLHHLVQFGGRLAKGVRHDAEGTRQTVAELAPQFFSRHGALRHHLLKSLEGAVHLIDGQLVDPASLGDRQEDVARGFLAEIGLTRGHGELRIGVGQRTEADAQAICVGAQEIDFLRDPSGVLVEDRPEAGLDALKRLEGGDGLRHALNSRLEAQIAGGERDDLATDALQCAKRLTGVATHLQERATEQRGAASGLTHCAGRAGHCGCQSALFGGQVCSRGRCALVGSSHAARVSLDLTKPRDRQVGLGTQRIEHSDLRLIFRLRLPRRCRHAVEGIHLSRGVAADRVERDRERAGFALKRLPVSLERVDDLDLVLKRSSGLRVDDLAATRRELAIGVQSALRAGQLVCGACRGAGNVFLPHSEATEGRARLDRSVVDLFQFTPVGSRVGTACQQCVASALDLIGKGCLRPTRVPRGLLRILQRPCAGLDSRRVVLDLGVDLGLPGAGIRQIRLDESAHGPTSRRVRCASLDPNASRCPIAGRALRARGVQGQLVLLGLTNDSIGFGLLGAGCSQCGLLAFQGCGLRLGLCLEACGCGGRGVALCGQSRELALCALQRPLGTLDGSRGPVELGGDVAEGLETTGFALKAGHISSETAKSRSGFPGTLGGVVRVSLDRLEGVRDLPDCLARVVFCSQAKLYVFLSHCERRPYPCFVW